MPKNTKVNAKNCLKPTICDTRLKFGKITP